MNPISAIADCIASIFKWMTGRNATKNAAPIVQAQTAQDVANADAKTDESIKSKNLDELRKESAE